ncbi:MAG: hypothetical protein GF383_16760 [Candidatus Lokiarchaeota archaeon]|nr:hypothetical protein [Candidatus Lokiarchaeota archaeon]
MEDLHYKTRSRSLYVSFYGGSIEIWLNIIKCKKDLFPIHKNIDQLQIGDILPRLLDMIKADSKKYWGIDLK